VLWLIPGDLPENGVRIVVVDAKVMSFPVPFEHEAGKTTHTQPLVHTDFGQQQALCFRCIEVGTETHLVQTEAGCQFNEHGCVRRVAGVEVVGLLDGVNHGLFTRRPLIPGRDDRAAGGVGGASGCA